VRLPTLILLIVVVTLVCCCAQGQTNSSTSPKYEPVTRLFVQNLDGPTVTVRVSDSDPVIELVCGAKMTFARTSSPWHVTITARTGGQLLDRYLSADTDQIVLVRSDGAFVATGALSAGPPPLACR
jgi:hypothetical protein